MSVLFVVIMVFLVVVTGVALLTRTNVGRAIAVGTIVIGSFLFGYVENKGMVHRQFNGAKESFGNPVCQKVWVSAQLAAHERLRTNALILLGANAALAIIAAAPRRKQ